MSDDERDLDPAAPSDVADFPFLQSETPERAGELLRLALQHISRRRMAPIPLNYALSYFYAAGTDLRFNEKMDMLLGDGTEWRHEIATDLFLRYFTPCNETSMAQLQQDLLSIVTGIIQSAVSVAHSADRRSETLNQHVSRLVECHDPKQALMIASEVLQQAQLLASEFKALASGMQSSAQEVARLKDELMRARREASVDALTGLNNRLPSTPCWQN